MVSIGRGLIGRLLIPILSSSIVLKHSRYHEAAFGPRISCVNGVSAKGPMGFHQGTWRCLETVVVFLVQRIY